MILDKLKLDDLLCNRHLIVVSGELTERDRKVLLRGLSNYNNKKKYMGEYHIEPFFCAGLSKGLKSIYGINEDTSILFFKSGLLEHTIQGSNNLFVCNEDFDYIVMENFGIILD